MRPFNPEFSRALPIFALAALTALPLTGCDSPTFASQLANGNTPAEAGPNKNESSSLLRELENRTPLNNAFPILTGTRVWKQTQGITTPEQITVRMGEFPTDRIGYYGLELNGVEMEITPPKYAPNGEAVRGTIFGTSLITVGDWKPSDDLNSFRFTLNFAAYDILSKNYAVDPELERHTILGLTIHNFSRVFASDEKLKKPIIPIAAFGPDGLIKKYFESIKASVTDDGSSRVFSDKIRAGRVGRQVFLAVGTDVKVVYLDDRFEIDEVR